MAKPNKKQSKPSTPQKRRSRKGVSLKRYNTLLSTTIKDLKKRGVEYDIKEVRSNVSKAYPQFKDTPPSRIGKKKILQAVYEFVPSTAPEPKAKPISGIKIQATEVPRYWFDTEVEWFELDEHIVKFNNTYPEIPIVIKSPENELKIEGQLGGYHGTLLQDFVNNDLRIEFDNASGHPFLGIASWQEIDNKQFAFWGTEGVEVPPNNLIGFDEVEPIKKVEIKRREDEKSERDKKEKQEKRRLRKLEKEERKKKEKEQPKEDKKTPQKPIFSADQEMRRLELRNEALKLLREDKNDGIYTEEEYKEERSKIMNQYGKGGIV